MTNPLLLWVLASLLAHALATNASAFVRARGSARVEAWRTRAAWRTLVALVRIAYFMLMPYAALITGLVTPQQFALRPLDDLPSWQTSALAALGVFAFVSLVLWLHTRTLATRYPPHVYPAAARRAQISQPWGAAFVLLDVLCLQAHWAFYRAGALAWLRDPLAGTLGGVALVLLEWALDPQWRAHLRTPGHAEDVLLVFVLALLSAWLFLSTPSLWLMLVVHATLWLGWMVLLQHWVRPRATYAPRYELRDA